MKRTLDLVLVGAGLLVCWPFLAAAALAIWLTDGRPIFFRQERIGRGGRPFKIWKFRTMVRDAERRGMAITVGRDPRITRVGHWLRKTKLDELPQLFNVLSGEMSLIGPRPEAPKYVALYTPEQRRVLDLTPGITDVASIAYCDENELLAACDDPEREYIEHIMPDKIRLNLEYAENASVLRDIGVIVRTLLRISSVKRLRPADEQPRKAA